MPGAWPTRCREGATTAARQTLPRPLPQAGGERNKHTRLRAPFGPCAASSCLRVKPGPAGRERRDAARAEIQHSSCRCRNRFPTSPRSAYVRGMPAPFLSTRGFAARDGFRAGSLEFARATVRGNVSPVTLAEKARIPAGLSDRIRAPGGEMCRPEMGPGTLLRSFSWRRN